MKRVKYISRFSKELSDTVIDAMTARAAQRNRELEVTGVLFASGGLFVQVLEGPEDAVDMILERISKDARHKDLLIVDVEESVEERLFPDWSMRRLRLGDESRERFEPLRAILVAINEHRKMAELLTGVLERAIWREINQALMSSTWTP